MARMTHDALVAAGLNITDPEMDRRIKSLARLVFGPADANMLEYWQHMSTTVENGKSVPVVWWSATDGREPIHLACHISARPNGAWYVGVDVGQRSWGRHIDNLGSFLGDLLVNARRTDAARLISWVDEVRP